jgi:type IV pilus assembly protein PilM
MQWFTHYSPIGLDIGSYQVKMAQLQRHGQQWVVHHMAVVPLPDAGAERAMESTQEIEQCLASMRATGAFRGKKVVSGLPCTEVDMRTVHVPLQAEPQDLQNLIRREAESYLPYSLEEAILDYSAAGEDSSSGAAKQRLLLVATRRQSVDSHLAVLQKAGLHCLALETSPLALSRLLLRQQHLSTASPVLVVEIGYRYSMAFILRQDIVMYNRTLPWGGTLLTQAIEKDLMVSAAQAERLKQQYSVDPHALSPLIVTAASRPLNTQALPGILWEIVRPQLEHLGRELERILSYWEAQFPGAIIDRVLLSGGGAALQNLDGYLRQRLGIDVALVDPLGNFPSADGPGSRLAQPPACMPAMAVAVGLALRGTPEHG